MSGKQVYNWRESDRSEYLAGFLLSALGMATPVQRHEELGADFYCSLTDQEKGAITFGSPFLVEVRSVAKPVVHIKAPKRYRHQKGAIPDHLSWLFRQELPMFLALVDKEDISIRLYSLSPLWFLYYDTENCPHAAALQLVPRVDGGSREPVGVPRQIGKVTSSPESYEYEVDLGHPIASFAAQETGNRQILTKQKGFLRRCLECDLRNRVFLQAGLPHFYWIAESGREEEGPIPAFYFREAPRDAETLNRIYSFLGPSLLPLALRYQESGRGELVGALRKLFREMPPDTIPQNVRDALPEIFTNGKKTGGSRNH